MIPLLFAKLCCDDRCETVYDLRQHRACPGCGFALAIPLAAWINRRRPAPHAPARPLPTRHA